MTGVSRSSLYVVLYLALAQHNSKTILLVSCIWSLRQAAPFLSEIISTKTNTHDNEDSAPCKLNQCDLIESELLSMEEGSDDSDTRVAPSALGVGRESGAEAGRIFLFLCANQQCDERAIPYTTDIKTHRAQW
jgi:hypothetical protein